MRRTWFVWAGIVVLFLALAVLPIAMMRGWFSPTVRSDWGHNDLAEHLRKKGIDVEVWEDESVPRRAIYTDRSNGSKVIVVNAPDREAAEEAVKQLRWQYPESFVAGHFIITAQNNTSDADLCRRIKAVLK